MEDHKQHMANDHSKHNQSKDPGHSQHSGMDHSMHNMEDHSVHMAHHGGSLRLSGRRCCTKPTLLIPVTARITPGTSKCSGYGFGGVYG